MAKGYMFGDKPLLEGIAVTSLYGCAFIDDTPDSVTNSLFSEKGSIITAKVDMNCRCKNWLYAKTFGASAGSAFYVEITLKKNGEDYKYFTIDENNGPNTKYEEVNISLKTGDTLEVSVYTYPESVLPNLAYRSFTVLQIVNVSSK